MPFIDLATLRPRYDTVVIGSGFGSLFFLYEHMKRRRPGRVLVLERGPHKTRQWQTANRRNSVFDEGSTHRELDAKRWHYTIGFGGGTNCWWAYAPRNHPHDFETQTRYGVGVDWPIGYDDLRETYAEAEAVMQIAGPHDLASVYPGCHCYVQPAHRMTTPDRMMKAAQPDRHFALPNARLRRPVGDRGSCCVSAECGWCPSDAKFTGLNTFQDLFEHPDVDILVEAEVTHLERSGGGDVSGVVFEAGAGEARGPRRVSGDLVVLGANAIHSPAILLRSGFEDWALGRFLHEKRSLEVEVLLDGLDGYDGSSILSAMNTTLLVGPHRRSHAGGLVNFESYPLWGVRLEYGRWAQGMSVNLLLEEIPLEQSRVTLGADGMPETTFTRSAYSQAGLEHMRAKLPEILAPLPVEDLVVRKDDPNKSVHVQGTTRMGRDPKTSVVDAGQIHHTARNLMIVGTSVFPSSGTASPSLTIAALSLRAARRLEASA